MKAYLRANGSSYHIARKHNILHAKTVRKWVVYYKADGDEGLTVSGKKRIFSYEFKLAVVRLYLTTKISYQELALAYGINNASVVAQWIQDYRAGGLKQHLGINLNCRPLIPNRASALKLLRSASPILKNSCCIQKLRMPI